MKKGDKVRGPVHTDARAQGQDDQEGTVLRVEQDGTAEVRWDDEDEGTSWVEVEQLEVVAAA
ncbi:MAG: hypothetical protein ACH37Z_12340 [Anaerolineae bacterium]